MRRVGPSPKGPVDLMICAAAVGRQGAGARVLVQCDVRLQRSEIPESPNATGSRHAKVTKQSIYEPKLEEAQSVGFRNGAVPKPLPYLLERGQFRG